MASERVEIGRALEEELKGRVGNPTFGASPIPENFPELPKGDTRDIAAKASGFGSGKAYERAKTVVDSGVPELVGLSFCYTHRAGARAREGREPKS